MKPEKLSERASRIAQEAKTILETVNRFGPRFEKIWLEAMRRSAMEEVERAFQKVMLEVEKKEEGIERLALFGDKDKEVWICATYSTSTSNLKNYFLSANEMKKESAWWVAAEMCKKGAIYVPVEDFKNLISELNTSILEGKQDENIQFTGEQLIYNKLYKAYQPNNSANLIL